MQFLILSVPFFLFSFGEFFGDMQLILKIFTFMAIYSFARNHVGGGALAIAVILILSFFVLFVAWPLFGTIYLLYMVFILGAGGVLIDFFFVTGSSGGGGGSMSPVSSGADVAKRMVAMRMAQGAARPRPPPGPPMRPG
jgi:hypothetical protein